MNNLMMYEDFILFKTQILYVQGRLNIADSLGAYLSHCCYLLSARLGLGEGTLIPAV